MNASGGGGDTGDSFLAQIDGLMGAPPIGKGGKGAKGGEGDKTGSGTLLQGLAHMLGIGNDPIVGKQAGGPTSSSAADPKASTSPAAQAAAPEVPTSTATPGEIAPAAGAEAAAGSAAGASGSTDLLKTIFKVVGSIF